MKRAYLYPTLLTLFFIAWSSTFATQFSVTDAVHNWTSLTMVLGSFVAGATPLGGGAVAFPVFTKLFGFEAHSAKVFSLAIQSVGMTFATIFFVSRGVRIYWSLLARLMPFALFGLACGFSLSVDGEPLKITFSFLLLACSYLLMQRCDTRLLQWRNSWSLYLIATLGGLLSAYWRRSRYLAVFLPGIAAKVRCQSTDPNHSVFYGDTFCDWQCTAHFTRAAKRRSCGL